MKYWLMALGMCMTVSVSAQTIMSEMAVWLGGDTEPVFTRDMAEDDPQSFPVGGKEIVVRGTQFGYEFQALEMEKAGNGTTVIRPAYNTFLYLFSNAISFGYDPVWKAWLEPYVELVKVYEVNNAYTGELYAFGQMDVEPSGFFAHTEAGRDQWPQLWQIGGQLDALGAHGMRMEGVEMNVYGNTKMVRHQMQNIEAFFAEMGASTTISSTGTYPGLTTTQNNGMDKWTWGMRQELTVDASLVDGANSITVTRSFPWAKILSGSYTWADVEANPYGTMVEDDSIILITFAVGDWIQIENLRDTKLSVWVINAGEKVLTRRGGEVREEDRPNVRHWDALQPVLDSVSF